MENSGEGWTAISVWGRVLALTTQPTLAAIIIRVRTPELNRVFTVAGATLARKPASGAALAGIAEISV